jgi:hypothetical protein
LQKGVQVFLAKLPRSAALIGAFLLVLLSACDSSSKSSEKSTSQSTQTATPSTEESSSGESFSRSNWDVLQSDPNAHKGAKVDFVGRVFTTPERDKKGVYLQVWEDAKNSENNTIVAYADPQFRVAEDDYVHVVGTVKSEFKGKNAFGADVTAPVVIAETLRVVGAMAAAPPALATLGPRTETQAGVTVLVRKVEFAAPETRVFTTIKNASGYDASVYTSSMKAVQAGRQHEPEFSSDYPEPSSDIVAGASTSGVVVFPKMNPWRGLKLIIEGSSDNTNAANYGSLKFTLTWP